MSQPFIRRATYNKVSDLINLCQHDQVEDDVMNPRTVRANSLYPRRIGGNFHGNNGFNLCLLVEDFKIAVSQDRVDGTRLILAQALVGDETASIQIRVQENNIGLLQIASDSKGAVVLRNVSLELHKGKYLRLIVSKFGKIASYPDDVQSTPNPPTFLNKNRNISEMEIDTKQLVRRHEPSSIENPFTTQKIAPIPFIPVSIQSSVTNSEVYLFRPLMNTSYSYNHYSMLSDDPQVLYSCNFSPSSWMYHSTDDSSIWYDEPNH